MSEFVKELKNRNKELCSINSSYEELASVFWSSNSKYIRAFFFPKLENNLSIINEESYRVDIVDYLKDVPHKLELSRFLDDGVEKKNFIFEVNKLLRKSLRKDGFYTSRVTEDGFNVYLYRRNYLKELLESSINAQNLVTVIVATIAILLYLWRC